METNTCPPQLVAPGVPPFAEVRAGEAFRDDMMDDNGGGITTNYSADEFKRADQSIVSFINLSSSSTA